MMRSIRINRYGERLRLSEVNIPQGDILLKMKYSPINPSDLYFS